jgi:hypothetical protein
MQQLKSCSAFLKLCSGDQLSFFDAEISQSLFAYKHPEWYWLPDISQLFYFCIQYISLVESPTFSYRKWIGTSSFTIFLDFCIPAWRLEIASIDNGNDQLCSHWCSLSVVHCKLYGIRTPNKSLWYGLFNFWLPTACVSSCLFSTIKSFVHCDTMIDVFLNRMIHVVDRKIGC